MGGGQGGGNSWENVADRGRFLKVLHPASDTKECVFPYLYLSDDVALESNKCVGTGYE